MKNSFLIKYAEIGVKGRNRYLFEDALVQNAQNALDKIDGKFRDKRIWTYLRNATGSV